jgi:hypothetical protein
MRMLRSIVFAGVLLLPLQAVAQGAGGSTGGSAGSTGASPSASPGAVSGSLSNPNPGSQISPNNLNSAGQPTLPNPPGTNSAGTAQSSGRGVTTGAASGSSAEDAKIRAEDPKIDKKIKSICKGC